MIESRMMTGGHVACTGEYGNAYNISVVKSEGKRPLVRQVYIGFKQTGCEDVDWIHLAQDRVRKRTVVNTLKNPRIPD
jgi:hypothetical protein